MRSNADLTSGYRTVLNLPGETFEHFIDGGAVHIKNIKNYAQSSSLAHGLTLHQIPLTSVFSKYSAK